VVLITNEEATMAEKKQYAIDITIKLSEQGQYGAKGAPPVCIAITGDSVPTDTDPVTYLRDRVLEELDRKTIVSKVQHEKVLCLNTFGDDEE
jgi:hypothetical protein